ncbi:MAG TPA: FAD-linked oxidase C-terminal domain-containing protein [Candidatus Baltobacteraceae bacterium]
MSVLAERLINALGADAVHTEPEDLAVYSFDAYSEDRLPSAAVVPKDVREVTQVVRIAAECGEPIVARGAGTGLCGGAVPTHGGIVVSFARMNRILEIDTRNRRAKVEPGLINLDLSRATARDGLFYAPDPASQKVSSLGGNIATNAGGPHCLSYGTTTNHVVGLEYVDSRGEVVTVHQDDPGYDLAGVLVGSEGTLGIVTSIDVRLTRLPEAVRVCVATFGDVESASEAVSQVIGAGIVPIALEIMDKVITGAVEAAFKAGYPQDAGAVLLVEIAGLADDMDASEAAIAKVVRACGALSWRAARSQAERDLLWAARKGAAGAIGRLAPNYYIQDCVVPRTKLPVVMRKVEEIVRDHQLQVGNVFHAGDGNLHPLLLFDRSRPRDIQAVIEAGSQILQTCIDHGGTISGEHGIGYEKRESLGLLFSADDLATMGRVRDVFDPARRFNPDKIFPSSASCNEVRAAS